MTKNRWVSELHWRREGQQTRSEKTQAALLDAAEALILEKGTEGTSIADIAKRADSSVGAVYHHFKDKTALYYALFHRMTDAYARLSKEASNPALWTDATVRDLFRGFMEISLAAARETGAAKAAVSAVIADHPALAAHYAEIQRETRKSLLTFVLERRDEIGRADAEEAAAFAVDQCLAMLRSYLDPAQKGAKLQSLNETKFIDRAVEMIALFLHLSPVKDA